MRRLTIRLDDELADRLAKEAERRGMPASEVIRVAVEHLLETAAAPAATVKPAPAAAHEQVRTTFGGSVQEMLRIRRPPGT
jgi:predicted transcriptional regulator